MQQDIS
jgi:hypothetical protein